MADQESIVYYVADTSVSGNNSMSKRYERYYEREYKQGVRSMSDSMSTGMINIMEGIQWRVGLL